MNSARMELEGLKRCLKRLEDLEVDIKSLVTDRHSGIAKYMQSRPEIQHYFDIWHCAKSRYHYKNLHSESGLF